VSETITQAAFARHIGMSKSYVTALKQAGRLVMTEDGKRVRVAESLARIDATKDPNRDDVKARHAAARAGNSETVPVVPDDPAGERIGKSFSAARAVKEKYNALRAKLDYEREFGTVVPTDDVHRTALDAGATLRATMENIPDQLAPQLTAISDREEIHGLLTEHIEHALRETSRKLASMGKSDVTQRAQRGTE